MEMMNAYAPTAVTNVFEHPFYYANHPYNTPMPPYSALMATPPAALTCASGVSSTMYPDTTVKSDPDDSPTDANGRRRSFKDAEEERRYKEKRSRNNEAAKKSRLQRREKERGMQERIQQLSEENSMLRQQLEGTKQELAQLREVLYGQSSVPLGDVTNTQSALFQFIS